jgi:Flp pilus assembly protein TadG
MSTPLHSRRDRRNDLRRPERSSERGAIAVLAAILLTLVMGFAALGFDLSYVRLARFEMKNATDAAAHAAMMVMRETNKDALQAKAAAISIAAKNTVLGHPVTLDDSDIVFGIWDYDTSAFTPGSTPYNAVQITGRKSDPSAAAGTLNTTFARVPGKGVGGPTMGVGAVDITQVSTSAFRARSMMFEMDVTGSFLTASCAIDNAIAADVAFLDAMYNSANAKDKIGLDVFVGSASPFTPLQNLQTNYAAMRADWFGDGTSALLSAHTTGLGVCTQSGVRATGNYPCPGGAGKWPNQDNLKAGFPMPSCWAADARYAPPTTTVNVFGGTNIGSGIASGIAALTATAKTYEVRAIVAFTDGGPLCCESQGGGALCPQPGPCCADATSGGCVDHGTGACACSAAVKQYGIDQADAAAALGIDVYVLAFGGYAPWINYARQLPRGRGFTLDTADRTQLDAKLTQIANAIPVALVK